MKERNNYMLCCSCGYAVKYKNIFKKGLSKYRYLFMPKMCGEIMHRVSRLRNIEWY